MFNTSLQENGWFYVENHQGVEVIRLASCNESTGSGCYGTYYNLRNGLGVKKLRSIHLESPNSIPFNVREENSHTHEVEVRNLIRANKMFPQYSPKFYGMVIIAERSGAKKGLFKKTQDKYYMGLLVEHIDGFAPTYAYKILHCEMSIELMSKNVYNSDFHDNNWMIRKDHTPVIIDWGCVHFNDGEPMSRDMKNNIEWQLKYYTEYLQKMVAQKDELRRQVEFIDSYQPKNYKKVV